MPFPVNSDNTKVPTKFTADKPDFGKKFGDKNADKNNNSIFSQYDDNKNSNIELSDFHAKTYVKNQRKEIKSNYTKVIQQNLKFDAAGEYNKIMEKTFKNFKYDSNAPVTVDRDMVVVDNLNKQSQDINNQLQNAYKQAAEKLKKELLEAKNDPDLEKFKSDLKTAKSEFEAHLKQDGIFADTADAVSKVWNNSVINLTGNTADMVREDLNKYTRLINKFMRTGDAKQREQIKSELKSMDIIKRVRDYNKSQEKGATTVEVGLGASATVLSGGNAAVGAAVVGAAKFVDETRKDVKQGKFDLTSKEGLERVSKNAALGVRDGIITYGAGKIVGAGGELLSKTGLAKTLTTKAGKYLVTGGVIGKTTISALKFASKKTAAKGVGTGMKYSVNRTSEYMVSDNMQGALTYIDPKIRNKG